MKHLYLLRHGIAVATGTAGVASDFDRALTDEGREKVEAIARALMAFGLTFNRVLSSPYVRARQTAEIVAATLGIPKRLRLTDNLAVDAAPRAVIRELAALRPDPARVLLVGHEPFLSELAAYLLTGMTDLAITLKKGGCACLKVDRLRPGRCAELEWLLTPRQMLLVRSP